MPGLRALLVLSASAFALFASCGRDQRQRPHPDNDLVGSLHDIIERLAPGCRSPKNLIDRINPTETTGPPYSEYWGEEKIYNYLCSEDSIRISIHALGGFVTWASITGPSSSALIKRWRHILASHGSSLSPATQALLSTPLFRCRSDYELLSIQLSKGIRWIAMTTQLQGPKHSRRIRVSLIPDIHAKDYLRRGFTPAIDTIEGFIYRWSGYDYIVPEKRDTCIDYFPAGYSPLTVYRVVVPPNYDLLQFCLDPIPYAPSCDDADLLVLTGFVGGHARVPHAGLAARTFFVLDANPSKDLSRSEHITD